MCRRLLCLALIALLPTFLVAQQTSQPAPSAGSSTATDKGPATAPFSPPQPHTLLDGTPVKMRISETVSSADAKTGEEVPFEVLEDVDVDGIPVIAKGAAAIGTVTDAEPRRRMGRAGKLDISISYVRLADGEKAALRAVKDEKGGGHVGAMTGAMVATSIVFFPAAPLFLFMHGKDISIPQGTEITAFAQGDMHLDMSKFSKTADATGGSVSEAASAAAAGTCSLVVNSTPPGADILIDGAFVGNTPSTVTLKTGSHTVAVTKKGYADWSRTLSVTGGTVNLDAILSASGD